MESLRQLPLAPALLVGFFVLASLLMVPVTALIVATILVFGSVAGFAYALAGTLLSALVGYGLGVWTGGRTHWPMTGGRTEAIADRIARNGLLAVATVRIVPVAPFAVINLVAGSSRIRLRDYMLGTLIGMGPGIAALAFFTDRLWASLRDPDAGTVATLVVSTLVVVGLLFGLNRWARGAQNGGDLADR